MRKTARPGLHGGRRVTGVPTVAVPKAQRSSQYLTVLDMSVKWAGPLPPLSWGGTRTRTKVVGGHSDACAAPVVECARGRRA